MKLLSLATVVLTSNTGASPIGAAESNKNPEDIKCSLKKFNISALSDMFTPLLTKDKGGSIGLLDVDSD